MTPEVDSDRHHACLHGINVRSEFELNGWPISTSTDPDEYWTLNIRRARVVESDPIERDLDQVHGDLRHIIIRGREYLELSLRSAQDHASTSIRADFTRREINVHCDLWFPESQVLLLYLLHTRIIPSIAVLTSQSVVMHATAVHVDDGAIVMCGRSGAGKSSLAAGFVSEGGLLLGDEPILIHPEPGRSLAQPSVQSLRLERETVVSGMLRERGWYDKEGHDKVVWSAPQSDVQVTARNVAAVLILGERLPGVYKPHIVQLKPVEAVQALMHESHLSVSLINATARQFTASAAIVQTTPVFRVHIPDDLAHLKSAVTLLRERIQESSPR